MAFLVTMRDQFNPLFAILDFVLLALLLYQIISIFAKTRLIQLIRVLFALFSTYLVGFILKLPILLWFMNQFTVVILIGLIVIFQPELRSVMTQFRVGRGSGVPHKATTEYLDSLIDALEVLSTKRRGALVVIRRKMTIKNVIETGTRLNANFSSVLLLTIFDHDTPLHDGAVVVHGNKILAAGCFLPLTEQTNIVRSFGARHRAAQGMAEDSDAVVLVVSEETGAISLACNEKLYYDLSSRELKDSLISFLNYRDTLVLEVEDD